VIFEVNKLEHVEDSKNGKRFQQKKTL